MTFYFSILHSLSLLFFHQSVLPLSHSSLIPLTFYVILFIFLYYSFNIRFYVHSSFPLFPTWQHKKVNYIQLNLSPPPLSTHLACYSSSHDLHGGLLDTQLHSRPSQQAHTNETDLVSMQTSTWYRPS
jgi:hypothetical protein